MVKSNIHNSAFYDVKQVSYVYGLDDYKNM